MALRILRSLLSTPQSASCCGGLAHGPVEVMAPEPRDAGSAEQSPGVALSTLKPGQTAVVRTTGLDASDAALLRAMGLRPEATVRLCRVGEPCIVEVFSGERGRCAGGCCRIGLARPLAEKVMVGAVTG